MILDGLRVKVAGDTVVTAAAGAMFTALGAHVETVLPLTRRPAAHATDRIVSTLARQSTQIRKDSVFDGEGLRYLADADVTIVDLADQPWAREDRGLDDYIARVDAEMTGAWVTVSPFGLDGPRRTYRGTELTNLAAGGIAHFMRSTNGTPMKPAGHSSSMGAGHFAVLAALHGLLAARDDGQPHHFDLSVRDSVVLTGVFLECAHRLFRCPGQGGAARYAAPRGVMACGEGLLLIIALEDHQWRGVVAAMGEPEWAKGLETRVERVANSALITVEFERWAAQFTAVECADLLQANGVPATAVTSVHQLLSDPDLVEVRQFFVPESDAGTARVPGIPAAFSEQPISSTGVQLGRNGSARPPRILDMSHVLAGPLATSWLASMGLDVLKVEDPQRTDVYRRSGPFPGEPDIEASAYFASANYGKRSHAVDMSSDDGLRRIEELVGGADIVIENLTASRAEKLGLTADNVGKQGQAVLIGSSGFGRTTSKAGYRVYGQNIHAAGGLIDLSRDASGAPKNVGTSLADPMTAIWIATIASCLLLRAPEERSHVDISMVEVIAYQFPEFFSAASAGSDIPVHESRMEGWAPHGIFRCAGDDNWLAIAVENDDDWNRMLAALGDPPALGRSEFATAEGRSAHQQLLEDLLAAALADRDRIATFHALQRHGVAASYVASADDLVGDDELWQRGLFQEVGHPVWGTAGLTGLPWRSVSTGAFPIRRTALLGEHTTDDADSFWLSSEQMEQR